MSARRDGSRGAFNGQPYVIGHQALKVACGKATTNAAGQLTFDISPAGFTTVAAVHVEAVRDTVDPTRACFAAVRSYTKDQVVVQVWESKTNAVLLLGGQLEAIEPTNLPTEVLLTVYGTV